MEQKLVVSAIRWSTDPRKIAKMGQEKVKKATFFNEHVLKIIKKFDPKSSCDIHGVSTKMIKFAGNVISIPLSHIFNLSLASGNFPAKLKQCRVIPIFKNGDQLECDNYRPISLLSSISKILEKIVAEKLVHHLSSNNLLYNHQYGFLPKRSTEPNLMQLLITSPQLTFDSTGQT
jgi:hypothetical protein